MTRRYALLIAPLLLLGCPGDDSASTNTDVASSTAGSSSGQVSTTTEPTMNSSTGVTPDPGSTSMTGSTGMVDSTSGGPITSCEDATTMKACSAVNDDLTKCGWFETLHIDVTGLMCMDVIRGGVCLATSQGDDSCGILREPSCGNSDARVYVRPSDQQDGAFETLSLEEFDACTGPDPGDGWEHCLPALMMEGCRCGCM